MEKKRNTRRKGIRALALILSLVLLFAGAAGVRYYQSQQTIATLSKMGSRGDEVRKVQQKLKNLGYYTGNVDGIFGTQTQSAVRRFQRDKGLSVDGIVGPKTLAALGITGSGSGQYSNNDIYLLAKVIAAEARGESYTGQVAIGAVVLNRVSHSSFPDSIAGVIYQPGAFSCVNDSNWSVEPTADSRKAALDAINGWDPTGGCLYYYNPVTATSQWIFSRETVTTIGKHVFAI